MIRDRQARETEVVVGQQSVGFSLERIRERPRRSRPGVSGDSKAATREKLKLTIPPWDGSSGKAQVWEDAESVRRESLLSEIAVGLVVAGEGRYRAGINAHYGWVIRRREELIEEGRRLKEEEINRKRERLAKLEKDRVERLFAATNDWRKAADLRAFVKAVLAANRDTSMPISAQALEQWASEALSDADRLDPLCGERFWLPELAKMPLNGPAEWKR